MKIFSRTTIKFSVFLSLFLFSGQAISAQVKKCKQITFYYMFTKLKSASDEVDSKEKTVKKLKSEIKKRKVFADLSFIDEQLLKSVGANDSLFKTIRENLAEPSEEESELYNLFLDNYKASNVEQTVKALEAAKEYVRKFGDDSCDTKLIEYFKEAIPFLEKRLNDYLYGVDAEERKKTDLKFKILKELTDKFNAKKWDEVFTLGKKVYEIAPEFVPLFLDLASLGFEQAKLYGNKGKYNAETLFYAELAIKLLGNSTFEFSIYSGLGYSYSTKDRALVRMNEIRRFMIDRNLYKTTFEPKK